MLIDSGIVFGAYENQSVHIKKLIEIIIDVACKEYQKLIPVDYQVNKPK